MSGSIVTPGNQSFYSPILIEFFKFAKNEEQPQVETISYKSDCNWQAELQVLNLFDSADNDIDYFYASRLPGEPDEGIEDHHYHPIEPRAFRVQMRYLF